MRTTRLGQLEHLAPRGQCHIRDAPVLAEWPAPHERRSHETSPPIFPGFPRRSAPVSEASRPPAQEGRSGSGAVGSSKEPTNTSPEPRPHTQAQATPTRDGPWCRRTPPLSLGEMVHQAEPPGTPKTGGALAAGQPRECGGGAVEKRSPGWGRHEGQGRRGNVQERRSAAWCFGEWVVIQGSHSRGCKIRKQEHGCGRGLFSSAVAFRDQTRAAYSSPGTGSVATRSHMPRGREPRSGVPRAHRRVRRPGPPCAQFGAEA